MRRVVLGAVCAGTLACAVAFSAPAADVQFSASREGKLIRAESETLPCEALVPLLMTCQYTFTFTEPLARASA